MVIKRSNMNVSYACTKKQTTVSYYTYKPNSGFEYTCVTERERKKDHAKISCHMTKMLYDSFSVSNTSTVMRHSNVQ